jgi:BirA family biotin operon repressor/biotin-[acetyl-CoA-carboxylase] ligase
MNEVVMSFPVYILSKLQGCSMRPLAPEALGGAHALWQRDVRLLPAFEPCRNEVYEGYATSGGPGCGAVFICDGVGSSLDAAHALHAAGALPVWTSVLAVSQQSGRGQMRRQWVSPAGNIYAALRFPVASNYPDSLSSLVAGYVFARAFEMCGIDVRMKWPNDLLLDDCKMAGILLEDRNGALLVGIGINVAHFPRTGCLREGAAVPACGLAARGFDFAPFELWRQLVDRAFFCYRNEVLRFSEDGLISRLEAYLAWVGRVVMIHGSDLGSCPGRLMGLSHDGALRVLLSGREQVLHSCSLSPIS